MYIECPRHESFKPRAQRPVSRVSPGGGAAGAPRHHDPVGVGKPLSKSRSLRIGRAAKQQSDCQLSPCDRAKLRRQSDGDFNVTQSLTGPVKLATYMGRDFHSSSTATFKRISDTDVKPGTKPRIETCQDLLVRDEIIRSVRHEKRYWHFHCSLRVAPGLVSIRPFTCCSQ